jgi:membrane protein implicated in regulation of membrane protease activity
MDPVRETYDLPERPPTPFRQWAVMLALPALALGLWLALPDSPITVALLAIALLVAVFVGVGMVLRSRELKEEPGRNPVTPPSVDRS